VLRPVQAVVDPGQARFSFARRLRVLTHAFTGANARTDELKQHSRGVGAPLTAAAANGPILRPAPAASGTRSGWV